jgi:hypothetical protein
MQKLQGRLRDGARARGGDGCVDVVRIEGLDSQGKHALRLRPCPVPALRRPGLPESLSCRAISRDEQGWSSLTRAVAMGCGTALKAAPTGPCLNARRRNAKSGSNATSAGSGARTGSRQLRAALNRRALRFAVRRRESSLPPESMLFPSAAWYTSPGGS